jgi:hypothetical protein
MTEAANFVIWMGIIWAIPLVSGILYLYCCKIGHYDD